MATITPTREDLRDPGNARLYKWETLTEADTATAVKVSHFSDVTVQVIGDFGTGGDIGIQGSLDGTNFAELTDPSGTALSLTAAGLETILQNTVWVRPAVDAGSSVDVDVFLLVR